MDCIVNYCREDLSSDLLVVGFYGAAVFAMVSLAALARSKSIQSAAMLIAGAWIFSIFTFFYLSLTGYFLACVMFDTIFAHHFWRMAKVEIFSAPLCIILLFEITFIVFAQAVALTPFWTLFLMNRIFELTLLYITGCALFRMHIRRLERKTREPIKDWRAHFVIA